MISFSRPPEHLIVPMEGGGVGEGINNIDLQIRPYLELWIYQNLVLSEEIKKKMKMLVW